MIAALLGSLAIGFVIFFAFFFVLLVSVIIPEKYKEKEGTHQRFDIIPVKPESIGKSATLLHLTADGTTFKSIPHGCDVFAWIDDDKDWNVFFEGESHKLTASNVHIASTGVDGVPFVEVVDIMKFSLLAGGDRFVRWEFTFYVPNVAVAPKCRHLLYSYAADGKEHSAPLHSTREKKPDTKELYFKVKQFLDNERNCSYVIPCDPDGKELSNDGVYVISKRIWRTCHIDDVVRLSLEDYIVRC